MPEAGDITERPPHTRTGRCWTHPSAVAVSTCAVCGRGLCIACAIPARGQVVGPECVSAVVEDLPPQPAPPAPARPRGDLLALAGFVLVLAVSFFPWSRFGVASGFTDAWRLHWSLLALASAVVGVTIVMLLWRGRLGGQVASLLIVVMAAGVAVGAILHATRPPPTSNAAVTLPWRVAVAGAGLAVTGPVWNAISGRQPPARS